MTNQEACPICGRECEKDVKRAWPDARCFQQANAKYHIGRYHKFGDAPNGTDADYSKRGIATELEAWHFAAQRPEVKALLMRESIETSAKEVASWSSAKREAADVTSPEFKPPPRHAEVVAARKEAQSANYMQRVGPENCIRCGYKTDASKPFSEQDSDMRHHLDIEHPGWLTNAATVKRQEEINGKLGEMGFPVAAKEAGEPQETWEEYMQRESDRIAAFPPAERSCSKCGLPLFAGIVHHCAYAAAEPQEATCEDCGMLMVKTPTLWVHSLTQSEFCSDTPISVEAEPQHSCDNSFGAPVVNAPSCVPAERREPKEFDLKYKLQAQYALGFNAGEVSGFNDCRERAAAAIWQEASTFADPEVEQGAQAMAKVVRNLKPEDGK